VANALPIKNLFDWNWGTVSGHSRLHDQQVQPIFGRDKANIFCNSYTKGFGFGKIFKIGRKGGEKNLGIFRKGNRIFGAGLTGHVGKKKDKMTV